MKKGKDERGIYGLRARFSLIILVSLTVCIAVFFLLNHVSGMLIVDIFASEDAVRRRSEEFASKMQRFVTENRISISDLSPLGEWVREQPLVLVELYHNGRCIYNSSYEGWFSDSEDGDAVYSFSNGVDAGLDNVYVISFADSTVEAVFYFDLTYRYYVIAAVVEIVVCALLFLWLFLRSNRRLIDYICRLEQDVHILEGGGLEHPVTIQGNDELTELARSMESMRLAFGQQIEQEAQIQSANRDLITQMSHDLRTPLTSLMLYAEILSHKKYENEGQFQDYLKKIEEKTGQIKQLSDHLFTYSLADRDRKEIPLSSASPEAFFARPLDEMAVFLKASGFQLSWQPQWPSCQLLLRQDYVNRIVDNIGSNLSKYAEPSVPIQIEVFRNGGSVGILFVNSIAGRPGMEPESTRIGLKSVCSMAEQMGGSCQAEQTDTVFCTTILFPVEAPSRQE